MRRLMRDLLTIRLLREVGPEPPSREVWIEKLSALGITGEASVSQLSGSVAQLCWTHEMPPPFPSQNAVRRRTRRSMRKKSARQRAELNEGARSVQLLTRGEETFLEREPPSVAPAIEGSAWPARDY